MKRTMTVSFIYQINHRWRIFCGTWLKKRTEIRISYKQRNLIVRSEDIIIRHRLTKTLKITTLICGDNKLLNDSISVAREFFLSFIR